MRCAVRLTGWPDSPAGNRILADNGAVITLGVHVAGTDLAVGVVGDGGARTARVPHGTGVAAASDRVGVAEGDLRDLSLDLGSVLDGWLSEEEPDRLDRVTLVRISPRARSIESPFDAWPARLRRVVDGGWFHTPGGTDLHGGTGPRPDPIVLDRALEHAHDVGARAVCVSATGALLDPSWETAAAELLMSAGSALPIVMAHEMGGRRFLEREAAAVLNAALLRAVETTLDEALAGLGAGGPRLALVRADGSRTSELEGRSLPVQLFGTRIAAAAQGAAAVVGESTAFVLVWSPHERRLLSLEEGILRARHLRSSSTLSGMQLSQRHAAQSRVTGPPDHLVTQDLVGPRPVVVLRADVPGHRDDDLEFDRFAAGIQRSVSQAHVVDSTLPELAALGAATALPQSEVLRYAVVTDRDDVRREQRAARRVAQGRVLAAADWPVDLVTLSEYYSPLSFLPSGPVLVRSHVVGRRAAP